MFGAVLVSGPRQVGKTTMLRGMTGDAEYVTLYSVLVLPLPPLVRPDWTAAGSGWKGLQIVRQRDGNKSGRSIQREELRKRAHFRIPDSRSSVPVRAAVPHITTTVLQPALSATAPKA